MPVHRLPQRDQYPRSAAAAKQLAVTLKARPGLTVGYRARGIKTKRSIISAASHTAARRIANSWCAVGAASVTTAHAKTTCAQTL